MYRSKWLGKTTAVIRLGSGVWVVGDWLPFDQQPNRLLTKLMARRLQNMRFGSRVRTSHHPPMIELNLSPVHVQPEKYPAWVPNPQKLRPWCFWWHVDPYIYPVWNWISRRSRGAVFYILLRFSTMVRIPPPNHCVRARLGLGVVEAMG